MALKSQRFFETGTAAQFEWTLQLYDQALGLKAESKSSKPENVIKLDKWYQNELPKKIKSRGKDAHMVHEEMVQTIKWKLARGKFRPNLVNLIMMNTPRVIMMETKKAFKRLLKNEEDIMGALTALTALKGVGPAMASAVLAAARPDLAPYMADECLLATGVESLDYTMKEYIKYVDYVKGTVQRLNTQGSGWTPHKVELAMWTFYIAADLKPDLLEDMPTPASAASAAAFAAASPPSPELILAATNGAAAGQSLTDEEDSSDSLGNGSSNGGGGGSNGNTAAAAAELEAPGEGGGGGREVQRGEEAENGGLQVNGVESHSPSKTASAAAAAAAAANPFEATAAESSRPAAPEAAPPPSLDPSAAEIAPPPPQTMATTNGAAAAAATTDDDAACPTSQTETKVAAAESRPPLPIADPSTLKRPSAAAVEAADRDGAEAKRPKISDEEEAEEEK